MTAVEAAELREEHHLQRQLMPRRRQRSEQRELRVQVERLRGIGGDSGGDSVQVVACKRLEPLGGGRVARAPLDERLAGRNEHQLHVVDVQELLVAREHLAEWRVEPRRPEQHLLRPRPAGALHVEHLVHVGGGRRAEGRWLRLHKLGDERPHVRVA